MPEKRSGKIIGNWVPAMDNYTITAIVNDHSEYKGEKQTVLKNVKVC